MSGYTHSKQEGSALVIVMVFVMVFLMLGLALYWLIDSQIGSTELERTDIKAFNVAEAGVDAGMLALKLAWPDSASETIAVDDALLRTTLQAANDGLLDPSRSSPSEFIQVLVYDNVDSDTGETTTVADPNAPVWDSNDDGLMFVDATSNVDNDRHRILILAERQKWPLDLPGYALVSNVISSNGQGLEVFIEDGDAAQVGTTVNPQGKGIDLGAGVTMNVGDTFAFDTIITDAVINALLGIAQAQGHYYEGTNAATDASTFLLGNSPAGPAAGSVVYVKNTAGGVEIGGNGGAPIGSVDKPVVVIIDTPDGSENGWDMKGNAQFYGLVIVLGNSIMRGTCGVHGAVYCGGTLENKGNGSSGEIAYNASVLWNINHQYVISVNIVPNTWEEYTLPRTVTTVAAP